MQFEIEEKVKNFITKHYKYVFILIITLLAFWVRMIFIGYDKGDFFTFSDWYDHLAANPGLSGLKNEFSNYPPLYLYFLKLATLLPFSKILSIKIIAIVFDFLMAMFAFRLVRFLKPESRFLPLLTYAAVLFTPTVILNSALWSQCDSMTNAFIIGSILYLLKNRNLTAFILLGIAFSFKLQAIFILPLFVIYCFRNRTTFAYFLLIPLIYFITIIPAYLAGRPMGELLGIYFSQMGYFRELTLFAPSIYQIFKGDFDTFNSFGIALAFSIVFMIFSAVVVSANKLTNELILKLSLLFLVVIPYVLPQMHDRYFYFADVFSVIMIFAMDSRKYLYLSMSIVLISFLSAFPFLLLQQPFIPFPWLTLGLLAVIVVLVEDIFRGPSLVATHDLGTEQEERGGQL